jgi:murein DD-endopeptidase MepM/ murein hydrolase activator NlpD
MPVGQHVAAIGRLFPALARARFAEVDMDAEFMAWRACSPEAAGAPLEAGPTPEVLERILDWVHRRHRAEHSFGGYLEDRRHLLHGTYLDATGGYLHLGVDVNVPQGTEVAAGVAARVALVDDDHDRDGGWGCRVFLAPTDGLASDVILLYAHLQNVRVAPGDGLEAETVIAEVGGPPDNGNWHPHLHLQAVAKPFFVTVLAEHFDTLDGYGHPDSLALLRAHFPNPLTFLEDVAAGTGEPGRQTGP